MTEREIVAPGPLLAEDGTVATPGWSRRPTLTYNPERLPFLARSLRLKEWDFYCVFTSELSLSLAIADGSLAGVVAAQLTDYSTRTAHEDARLTPLGAWCRLPRTSAAGDTRFRGRGVSVELLRAPGERTIRLRWERFAGGETLDADLRVVDPPGTESVIVATPIPPGGFYYNEKLPGLVTTGRVALGARSFDMTRALTTMDWGRGLWPYRTFWLWASGAGYLPDGRRLGLNLGAGFGDLSRATENAVFVDGRISKLGAVDFDYDAANPCGGRPWRFRARDGRLDLTLAPDLFVLQKSLNALVIRSRLEQVTGFFRGFAVLDSGERVEIDGGNVPGWAEEHRARW